MYIRVWKAITTLAGLILAVLASHGGTGAQPPTCDAGTTARFEIFNNCGEDVWVVETPPGGLPGNPAAAVRAQWQWFKNYTTKTNPHVPDQAGLLLSKKTGRSLCVPDKGAPGGNFRFFMKCPNDNTDPFDTSGCVLGAAAGDLASINTLFEATFGCDPALSNSQCAFNPSGGLPPPTSTVASGLNNTTDPVTFTVASASGFPVPTDPFKPFEIGIDGEILTVTAVSATDAKIFTAKRAQEGTAAAPHGDKSPIFLLPNCLYSPSSTSCPPIAPNDNFDISAVDGYTIPLDVVAQPLQGKSCNRLSTDAGILDLASCPVENALTLSSTDATQAALIKGGISLLNQDATGLKACSAPYKWFQTGSLGSPPNPAPSSGGCNPVTSACFYAGAGCDNSHPETSCPGGSGPQQRVGPAGDGKFAIQNTSWVQQLYGLGYAGYTWQYGDGVGDQTCDWGGHVKVTLCPAGGIPYQKNQLWKFSASTGTCSTDGTTGTPDGTTTFKSLAACQTAKMRYTCHDLTADDPFKIPTALWRADPAATVAGTGFTDPQVQALKTLVCDTFVRTFPQGGGNGFNGGGQGAVMGSGLNNTTDPATFSVDNAGAFPTSGSFAIQVDSEILKVTKVTGNSFTAKRAQDGTTAAAHANGAHVIRALELPICNYVYAKPPALCPSPPLGCGGSPIPSGLFTFKGSGRAQNVGVERDSGNLRITGEFTLPGAVALDKATVLLTHLLDEKGPGGDLARGAGGAAFLPLSLPARKGSKPTGALYQTASGVRPQITVEVKHRDAGKPMEFSITVDRATIAEPEQCASGPTADINTTFALQFGCGDPVLVDATLPWQCRKKELRTP